MVAIKDFGMPSCCINCDMCLPCALNEGLCHITQKTLSDIYDKRDSDCPLVEIDEHNEKLEKIEQIIDEVKNTKYDFGNEERNNAFVVVYMQVDFQKSVVFLTRINRTILR